MIQLDLPSFSYRIREEEGKTFIFGQIRKKYLVLTPEEWVRQHFINFLIVSGYPKGLISVESGLKVNRMSKRTDILVLDRNGEAFMLVECKAPNIKLDNRTLEQAAVYNLTHKAPYLTVSNGLAHVFCKIDLGKKKYEFLNGLPAFGQG